MSTQEHHGIEIELALLRRGVDERSHHAFERCDRCRRTPLIGERIYELDGGRLACELCLRELYAEPIAAWIVHGHTIRILDRRDAA